MPIAWAHLQRKHFCLINWKEELKEGVNADYSKLEATELVSGKGNCYEEKPTFAMLCLFLFLDPVGVKQPFQVNLLLYCKQRPKAVEFKGAELHASRWGSLPG
jgi:hypothetical protein